ncbi:MAG: glycine cleavage system protein H [Enterococcus sp.]
MSSKYLKKKDNLWFLENGKEVCIGITKEAQEELGEITFINLPTVGQTIKQGDALFEVEAEKAVSEFASPVSGTISSLNEKIAEDIHVLNTADELDAWVLSLKDVDTEAFSKL